jgi:hypothetical protein
MAILTQPVVVADKRIRLPKCLRIQQAIVLQEFGCVLEIIALMLAM